MVSMVRSREMSGGEGQRPDTPALSRAVVVAVWPESLMVRNFLCQMSSSVVLAVLSVML